MYISKISIRFSLIILILTLVSSSAFAGTKVRVRDFIDVDTLAAPVVNRLNADTSRNLRMVSREQLRFSPKDSLITADSLGLADTTSVSVADSVAVSDSLSARDTLPRPKGMVDRPAFSVARDSTVEDFSNGRNMIYYYGDVKVTYGDMELTAEYMEYDVNKKVVYAAGVADTNGVVTGKPKMTQAGKAYSMDNVFYNFETGKARIKNMITDEEDGQLRGDNLNMMPNKSINISGGKYTVCELDHPHYYLKMSKAVVETEPKQKTVFGPAWLVLEDVPLPIVLPFGFVPKRPDRASGILFPTFGEEEARGLFMKDGGFYFVIGDYFDMALTGSIFTKGSWNVKMSSRYKLRYKFNGTFDLEYSNDQTGDKGSPDFFQTKNFGVKWSHTQDSKANPGTSFRASVNFSSPSNNRYNSTNMQEALQSQIQSSISYSKTWSALSLSVNALHNQNSRDSSYSLTLPNITLNVNKFYPFKRKNKVGKSKWYEDFSIGYNTSFQNKIDFKAREIKEPDFWKKLKTGMTHKFDIKLPTFTLLKYINFSPTVNYGMNWYFSSQNQYYNPETNKMEVIRTNQFDDFGVTQTFSAGLSMSTRIYGLFNFRRGKLKAIRHMISPSLSASFSPEMGTAMNGWRIYNYTDVNGVEKSVEYNKWAGGINSPPQKGKTGSLNFSVKNNIEAKVVNPEDTTGTGTRKIKIIDNLGLSGSYNFLADSMKLSNIRIDMNTNILEKVGISANMTLDPYAIDERGRRHNVYNITQEGGFNLFRLTNASVSANFSINGEGRGKGNDGSQGGGGGAPGGGHGGHGGHGGRGGSGASMSAGSYNKVYYHPVTGEYIPGGWVYYLNPNVPWALNFSYSYSYSKSYQYTNEQLIVKNTHTQTLSMSAQVRLTKDLNINVNTGFDITKLKLSTTQLSATYDLHCFQISFSWIPMGQWSSWSFRINAKAAALADLLQYRKQSSQWDARR